MNIKTVISSRRTNHSVSKNDDTEESDIGSDEYEIKLGEIKKKTDDLKTKWRFFFIPMYDNENREAIEKQINLVLSTQEDEDNGMALSWNSEHNEKFSSSVQKLKKVFSSD